MRSLSPSKEIQSRAVAATVRWPRWRHIQSVLEEGIRSGALPPGDRLPAEEELARRFEVHRNTIRRVLYRLREKNLVRIEQGSGTFVREPAVMYVPGARTRLSAAITGDARRTQRHVLSSAKVRADHSQARALSVPPGSALCRVDSVRLVDDRPVSLGSHFYPLPRFAGIDEQVAVCGSISESMRHFGVIHLLRKNLRVRAVMPSVADAKLLHIGRSKPLVELLGVSVDESGRPVQLAHSKLVSAWFDLVFEFGA